MVGMQRNKRTFWFARQIGTEDVRNEHGYKVGTKTVYGPVERKEATISQGAGNAVLTRFGLDTPTTRTIGPLDLDCSIDSYSKVWIDVQPLPDKDGIATTANDYVVNDIQRSLNHIMCVVRKTNNGVPE